MIKIRQSMPADGERVIDIWKSAVDATHSFLNPQDRIDIEQEVRSFLPTAPLWLAVDAQDMPLGFMLLEGEQMEALFIDAAARGMGVGKMLLQHACDLYPKLTTTVNEQNTQAVGFYAYMGFMVTRRSETDDQGRPYPLLHLSFDGETQDLIE